MKIDVIIPNYNGSKIIEKNLNSVVRAVKKHDAGIIIVDDHSKIEDYEALESFIARFRKTDSIPISLIRNKRNYGFSKTVNVGAGQSSADLLVLLNSDVIPEENFLDSVIPQFEEQESLFAVGCMDRSIEGGKEVLRGRGLGKFEQGFLMHRKGSVDDTNTLWVSGGSSIVRASIFQKLGGFDEIYNPFYWEDIDLSYRALKSGYKIKFDRKSVVEHRHEEGAIKQNFTRDQVKKIAYRNQIIFVWKNITDVMYLLSHLWYFPYYVLRFTLSRDWMFFSGLFLAIVSLPEILSKRKRSKQLFVLSDKEVFHNVLL